MSDMLPPSPEGAAEPEPTCSRCGLPETDDDPRDLWLVYGAGAIHVEPQECIRRLKATLRAQSSEIAELRQDKERLSWLENHPAVGLGVDFSVTRDDAALVYEKVDPATRWRAYWYPDTPIGFYEVHGATLREAIDAARSSSAPPDEGSNT